MSKDNIINLEESEVEVIDVSDAEIVDIELDEVFGTIDEENNALNHASLNNRDIQDQHPITAITGLREELDRIESLQTVYSDNKHHANYYMWHDGNEHKANRSGLFVSIEPGTDHIVQANGETIVFGVTVAEAGFVGGQSYIESEYGKIIGRDRTYGLVVTSGIVGVRCASTNIKVGDYVVPNWRGEAIKSDGEYGYLVTALSVIYGDTYAMILFNASSTLSQQLYDEVKELNADMNAVQSDIVTINNLAMDAYQEALKAQQGVSSDVEGIISDKINGAMGSWGDRLSNVEQSAANAAQKAETAQNAANSISSEALQKVEEAFNKVQDIIDDTVKEHISEMEGVSQEAVNALQDQYEALNKKIGPWENTADITQTVTDHDSELSAVTSFTSRNEDADNLLEDYFTEFKKYDNEGLSFAGYYEDGAMYINGFSEASIRMYVVENLQLQPNTKYILTGCPNGGSSSTYYLFLTNFNGTYCYDYGSGVEFTTGYTDLKYSVHLCIEDQTECKRIVFRPCLQEYQIDSQGMNALVEQVDKDKAALSLLSGYTHYDEHGEIQSKGIAGLTTQVDKSASELDILATFTHTDKDGTYSGVAGLVAKVSEHSSELDAVAKYEHKDENGESTTGLAGLLAQVDENQGALETLAKFECKDKDGKIIYSGIAGMIESVNAHEAQATQFSAFETEAGNKFALLTTQADANSSCISSIVGATNKYYVGPYSPTYNLTKEQANIIVMNGTIYVPTTNHQELSYFTRGYDYTWDSKSQLWQPSVQQTVRFGVTPDNPPTGSNQMYVLTSDYSDDKSNFFAKNGDLLVSVEGATPGYMGSLYHWEVKASTSDSFALTPISQIKQEADKITAEIANARGDAASLKLKLDNMESSFALSANLQSEMEITIDKNKVYASIDDIPWADTWMGRYYAVGTNAPYSVYRYDGGDIGFVDANVIYDGDKVYGLNSAYIIGSVNDYGGSQIKLNANMINFQAQEVTVKNGDTTTFSIDSYGNVTVRGDIKADNGYIGSCTISDGEIKSNSGCFSVDKTGHLFAKEVEISGQVTANEGYIGNFKIDNGAIKYKDNPDNFTITKDGYLKAQNVNISGSICVGEGATIGVLSIGKDGMITSKDGYFGITSDGKFEASQGSIAGWNITETDICCKGAASNIDRWVGMYSGKEDAFLRTSLDPNTTTSAIRFYAGANPKYNTDVPFMVLNDGSLYASCAQISGEINATSGKVGNWVITSVDDGGSLYYIKSSTYSPSGYYGCLLNPNPLYGNNIVLAVGDVTFFEGSYEYGGAKFKVTADGTLYASNAHISGDITANRLYFTTTNDANHTLTCMTDDDTCTLRTIYESSSYQLQNRWTPSGAEFSSFDNNEQLTSLGFIGASNAGFYIEARTGIGYLSGTWKLDSGASITSDFNKKKDIEMLSDCYETLFDNLVPVRFKYMDGTSDRFHTGFIAQEVEEAVLASGLTTQDAALFVREQNGTCSLRYSEFIALCVNEIQKLKKRVAELETNQND